MGQGGDVHAALRNPGSLEPAGAADVEVGDERVDEALVRDPARVGGAERGEEGAGELEVAGLDEAEGLEDVAALGGDAEGGAGGRGEEVAEDGEVEGARSGAGAGGGVLGQRRGDAEGGEEDGEERGGGAAGERHGKGGEEAGRWAEAEECLFG